MQRIYLFVSNSKEILKEQKSNCDAVLRFLPSGAGRCEEGIHQSRGKVLSASEVSGAKKDGYGNTILHPALFI